jgi:hypothetical protein
VIVCLRYSDERSQIERRNKYSDQALLLGTKTWFLPEIPYQLPAVLWDVIRSGATAGCLPRAANPSRVSSHESKLIVRLCFLPIPSGLTTSLSI